VLRKALSLTHVVAGTYPDALVTWARPAVRRATTLARRHGFDAVISSCPPESNHIVGSRVARRLGVPWIAMFGDLYGFFLAPLPAISPSAALSRFCHRRWLAPAAALTGVSPYMVDYLARTYGRRAALVLVGYDPADLDAPPAAGRAPRDRLLVSHVGSLYPGNQRPEIFLDGLDQLLRERPEVESRLDVRFVGSKCDETLRTMVRGRPAERVLTVLPKVDSRAAVALVRDSDALVVFNCTAFRDRHGTLSYPSKIFEAFGARRPVLAVPPDGDWVDALLARTNGGTSAGSARAVAHALGTWIDVWLRTGGIPYSGDPAAIAAFTYERQAERLAALLDAQRDRVAHAVSGDPRRCLQ
jgi:glycosyltransferase involved in cell wall biosynthesis